MIAILPHEQVRRPFLYAAIIFGLAMVFFAASKATAAELKEHPHWSVEVKGGYFYPAADDWAAHYGSDKTWQFAGSLAYKLTRHIEAGIEGGMMQDQGAGSGQLSGTMTGKVDYALYPLNVFVLFRGVFNEEQFLVPYAGGGYTRMFYRQNIEGQGTAKGAVNGYHGRAGLQFLLDRIDVRSANNMYMDYGILHTYFFLEAQYISAKSDTNSGGTIDLGGTSYLAGFLFEF